MIFNLLFVFPIILVIKSGYTEGDSDPDILKLIRLATFLVILHPVGTLCFMGKHVIALMEI